MVITVLGVVTFLSKNYTVFPSFIIPVLIIITIDIGVILATGEFVGTTSTKTHVLCNVVKGTRNGRDVRANEIEVNFSPFVA